MRCINAIGEAFIKFPKIFETAAVYPNMGFANDQRVYRIITQYDAKMASFYCIEKNDDKIDRPLGFWVPNSQKFTLFTWLWDCARLVRQSKNALWRSSARPLLGLL